MALRRQLHDTVSNSHELSHLVVMDMITTMVHYSGLWVPCNLESVVYHCLFINCLMLSTFDVLRCPPPICWHSCGIHSPHDRCTTLAGLLEIIWPMRRRQPKHASKRQQAIKHAYNYDILRIQQLRMCNHLLIISM